MMQMECSFLNIEQYDLVNRDAISSIDEKYEIKYKNPAGNECIAVIDTKGNFKE